MHLAFHSFSRWRTGRDRHPGRNPEPARTECLSVEMPEDCKVPEKRKPEPQQFDRKKLKSDCERKTSKPRTPSRGRKHQERITGEEKEGLQTRLSKKKDWQKIEEPRNQHKAQREKKPYGITLITCNSTLVYIIDYLRGPVSGNFDVKIDVIEIVITKQSKGFAQI